MIRFKCIYCGQRILAPDDGADKKGKCPKCNHLVVVPFSTKGRPAISPNKEPMPEHPKPYVPAWDRDTHSLPCGDSDMLIELYKESYRPFIPTYDKLSLFLMVIMLILLYLGNSRMRDLINNFIILISNKPDLLVLFILSALPLYVIFSLREKAGFAKTVMMLFAVLTNSGTGIAAGWYVIKSGTVHSWLLIFPVWNIVNGVLMLLMLRFRIIDEECISDRSATLVQIILGLTAVLIIFVLCNYVFKLYWAVTFSICIVYTTSFDKALQSILPGLRGEEGEQS